jgi:hypothetical protein
MYFVVCIFREIMFQAFEKLGPCGANRAVARDLVFGLRPQANYKSGRAEGFAARLILGAPVNTVHFDHL